MACNCGKLGCTCADPECTNGWLLDTEHPKTYGGYMAETVARPCRTCKPLWRHPAVRRAAATSLAEREVAAKAEHAQSVVDEDARRQASMFGEEQPEDQVRHPVLGRGGD